MTYTELQNSPELTLAVHFVGEADQVTQLFPQNILRGMGYPLDIQVILKVGLQRSRDHVRDLSCGKGYAIPQARLGRLFSLIQEEIRKLGEKCSHFWYVLLIRSLTELTFAVTWQSGPLAVRTSYAFIIPFFTEKVPLSYTFC